MATHQGSESSSENESEESESNDEAKDEHNGSHRSDHAAESQDDDLPDGVVPPEVISLEEYDTHPVWTLHRKLGHLGFSNMRLLLKMSNGIDVTDTQIKVMIGHICPVCATAKGVKHIPKDPARRRATKLGELIHVDGWGLYNMASWNGHYHILVLTDDATRMSWCIAYSNKDQLPVVCRDLHNRIEKKYNVTIRGYRMDSELPSYGIF
jgi:hypothetical protein